MRLFFRKKKKSFVPTRPGVTIGFQPWSAGTIAVHYRCGHVEILPSDIKSPYMCPNKEHEEREPTQ